MADLPGTLYQNFLVTYGNEVLSGAPDDRDGSFYNPFSSYTSQYDPASSKPVILRGFPGGAPCGSTDAPTIELLSPTAGTLLTQNQPITFDVVYPQDIGDLGFINITINEEAVLNAIGGFTTKYAASSTQTNPNAYTRRFSLVRAPEWMLNPVLFVEAITSSGIPLA